MLTCDPASTELQCEVTDLLIDECGCPTLTNTGSKATSAVMDLSYEYFAECGDSGCEAESCPESTGQAYCEVSGETNEGTCSLR